MPMKIPINVALIKNLLGEFEKDDYYYMEKEKAYESLKFFTGQDFGYDAEAWIRWYGLNMEYYFPENTDAEEQDTET